MNTDQSQHSYLLLCYTLLLFICTKYYRVPVPRHRRRVIKGRHQRMWEDGRLISISDVINTAGSPALGSPVHDVITSHIRIWVTSLSEVSLSQRLQQVTGEVDRLAAVQREAPLWRRTDADWPLSTLHWLHPGVINPDSFLATNSSSNSDSTHAHTHTHTHTHSSSQSPGRKFLFVSSILQLSFQELFPRRRRAAHSDATPRLTAVTCDSMCLSNVQCLMRQKQKL